MQKERQGEQERASGFRRLADSVIHFIKQDSRPMLGPEPSDKQIRRDLDKKAERAGEILGSDERILSEQPQPGQPLESAEKEWAEVGPTGIYSPHKTITIHRETRIAVAELEKDLPKLHAEMRKIKERRKKDETEQARLFDEMRNVHFRQPA